VASTLTGAIGGLPLAVGEKDFVAVGMETLGITCLLLCVDPIGNIVDSLHKNPNSGYSKFIDDFNCNYFKMFAKIATWGTGAAEVTVERGIPMDTCAYR
jgi:hypothetical protein